MLRWGEKSSELIVRRIYFGIWTAVCLALLSRFDFVLPGVAVNFLFPRDSTWKRRLLFAIYVPVLIVLLSIAFSIGHIVFIVFSLVFFLFGSRRRYNLACETQDQRQGITP